MTQSEADYLVVGAGAAGCLLANRLSADEGNRVLLLEAGGPPTNPLIKIPLLAGLLYYWRGLNWGYRTEADNGIAGRSLPWPRGRVVGGSTAINGMMYVRGNAADYDGWAQALLPEWSYANVLPLFKVFERNLSHRGDDTFHGRAGELIAARARGDHPIYRAWLAAAVAAGHLPNDDFNGVSQEGVGHYDFNIDRGHRVTAETAFLHPVRSRRNLRVMPRAQVSRLLFDGRRCVGVEVQRAGRLRRLFARREVILCAGSIGSPQLLQLSGIGDPARLADLGIPVVRSLPEVGRNLQDHLGVYLQYVCRQPITLYSLMRPDRALWACLQALTLRRGPATGVPLEVGGFLKTRPTLDIPDVHVTVVPGLSLAASQSGQGQHGFLTNVYQLRPESRGEMHILSRDHRCKPRIVSNYLSAEADRVCLRDGVRLVRKIMGQPQLDELRGDELAPGSLVQTDAQIDDWVGRTANTIFHPVGTCRMGADLASVVDSQLRVRGIAGLRVADASVMPSLIGGNTSVPTMMIAENAAQFILRGPVP